MNHRTFTALALLTSAALGAATGAALPWGGTLVTAADEGSITGVQSGASGAAGTSTVPPGEVQPNAQQSVTIENARGTDAALPPPENVIQSVSSEHGSIESVPGIEGLEVPSLQNLEAVLRMQDRTKEQQSQGAVRSAASLLSTGDNEPTEMEEIPDAREEHAEFELEGS